MCVTPNLLWLEKGPNHVQQPTACGKCWQCLNDKIGDFVGRCLCEAATSARSLALTLTYAPRDDLSERVLTTYHFQDFIRSVRRAGTQVRYLVAGEYGERKGRAHFHAVLFFPEEPTAFLAGADTIRQRQRSWVSHWPHGHVFGDWSADTAAIRYVAKYVAKLEADKNSQSWLSLSKKPPLGWVYLDERARVYAQSGLWPRSWRYMPPDASTRHVYRISGASRRYFIDALVRYHGGLPPIDTFPETMRPALAQWDVWRRGREYDAGSLDALTAELKEKYSLEQSRIESAQRLTLERYLKYELAKTARIVELEKQWQRNSTHGNGGAVSRAVTGSRLPASLLIRDPYLLAYLQKTSLPGRGIHY